MRTTAGGRPAGHRGEPRLADLLSVDDDAPGQARGLCAMGAAGRIYGGALVAHMMGVAMRAAPAEGRVHSLRVDFLRPGEPSRPVVYSGHKTLASRRFVAVGVAASQGAHRIASGTVAMHSPEPGPRRASSADVAWSSADDSPHAAGFAAPDRGAVIRRPFEVRRARPLWSTGNGIRTMAFWLRCREELVGWRGIHDAAVAWFSDFALTRVCALSAPGRYPETLTSLNHSMWFHASADVNEWMLYELSSPAAAESLALAQGRVFTADRRLVATVTQECLLRSAAR